MHTQNVRERFQRIVREVFQQALRPRRFKRRFTTFYRQLSNVTHLVNIQSSVWNTDRRFEFTINLGVYRSGFVQVLYQRTEPQNPSISSVPLQTRIGYLDPDLQIDKWWELGDMDSPEKDERVVSELVWRLEQHGIPFLERFNSDKDILEYFEEYCVKRPCGVLEMMQFAALAYLAEDMDRCQWGLEQALSRLLQRANDPAWAEHIPDWLKTVSDLASRICPKANFDRIIRDYIGT